MIEQVKEITEIADKISLAYAALDLALGIKYGLGKTTFTIWDNDNNAVAYIRVSEESDDVIVEFQN